MEVKFQNIPAYLFMVEKSKEIAGQELYYDGFMLSIFYIYFFKTI